MKDTGTRHKNSAGNMAVKQFLTGDFRRIMEKYNALPNAPLVISSLNNELVGWQIIDGLIQVCDPVFTLYTPSLP